MGTSKRQNMNNLQTRKMVSLTLHISERQIDRMIKAGKIKAIKIGKLVRIPQSEIDRIVVEGSSL
jgi:excisionase family DNA binding protein